MKNPDVPTDAGFQSKNRKLRLMLRPALWGAVIGAAFKLLTVFGDEYLGWTQGSGISFPGLLSELLPELVRRVAGWDHPYSGHFSNTLLFSVLVNSLAGAICLILVSALFSRASKSP